jgi:UDP-N-acetylmuramoyl-L-alanyl-D-glutamate--2,6-diaminopimelate ligase
MKLVDANQVLEMLKQMCIKHITNHSKRVIEGSAFFLCEQDTKKAIIYAKEALKNGAKIIFTENKVEGLLAEQSCVFYVNDMFNIVSIACDFLYPSVPPNIIFVTGTNGKTSVVGYVRQILSLLGEKSASIGTLGVISDFDIKVPKHYQVDLTTPDNLLLRQILHHLSIFGVTFVSIEASSHGIVQGRLRGLKAKCIGFTSFSDDHLDYHSSKEEYLKAKCQIFYSNAGNDTKIVIKEELLQLIPVDIKNSFNIITIGGKDATVCVNIIIEHCIDSSFQQKVSIQEKKINYQFISKVFTKNQIYNILMSAYLVECIGINKEKIISQLSNLIAPSGRLEQPLADHYIFIDYAHNACSLKEVLIDLLELRNVNNNSSRLIMIFGCGGNRYEGKRYEMGEVAQIYADIVIVTDDNPRYENPQKIRNQIMQPCVKAIEIGNRHKAIEYALHIKKDNDIVLIAGKGHENYQYIQGEKISILTDAQVVKNTYAHG